MPVHKPKPIVLSMLICDEVIEDRETSKKSLIGLFNNIHSEKIPCVHPRICVFSTLTDGKGDCNVALKFVKQDDENQLLSFEAPIKFFDPKQVVELKFEICGLVLPEFGDYRFDLYYEQELLISRKFMVSPIQRTNT